MQIEVNQGVGSDLAAQLIAGTKVMVERCREGDAQRSARLVVRLLVVPGGGDLRVGLGLGGHRRRMMRLGVKLVAGE